MFLYSFVISFGGVCLLDKYAKIIIVLIEHESGTPFASFTMPKHTTVTAGLSPAITYVYTVLLIL
jgi:hypothetical protein